jgi:hypothetical protein
MYWRGPPGMVASMPQRILRIGEALQAAIGQGGPIHLAAAAVHQHHPVGGAEHLTQFLQQGEEAPIASAPQPASGHRLPARR